MSKLHGNKPPFGHEELRRLVHYNPATGVFRRLPRMRKRYKSNTSGCQGIYKNALSGLWVAHIRKSGKTVYKEEFRDIESAVTAREKAFEGIRWQMPILKSKNRHGYTIIPLDRVQYRAHRLAWLYMYGEWPDGEIDHINHDRSDNRIANLRLVTRATNAKNLSQRRDNKSGITGVTWYKQTRKWHAKIRLDGKSRHLGYYNTIFDAAACRKSAENRLGYHPNHGAKNNG